MYKIHKDKFLSKQELIELDAIIDFGDSDRDLLIIRLAKETGARATEILSINTLDVDHEERSLFIRGIKNSNDRQIPLRRVTYDKLCKYIEDKSGRVFNINYRRLEQVWRKHRPANKTFHSLRHTFAIELYKKTKDIKLVQLALGHKDIKNTMVYVDFVYSQEELRRLIL
jgi:integrase